MWESVKKGALGNNNIFFGFVWVVLKGVGLVGLLWIVIWVKDIRTRDEVVVTAL